MRVLMVPSAVGYAHVGRALTVAKVLARRGHEVAFAFGGDPGLMAGYAVRRCHDVVVMPPADIYAAWTIDDVRKGLDGLVDVIRDVRPDVVIGDLHPLATVAAKAAGVASVGLLTAGFTPRAADLIGATGLLRHIARFGLAVRGRALARPFREVGRGSVADLFRGDVTLVTELASFVGPAAGDACTGPIVWDEPGTTPPRPPPGVARIYATTGNTGAPWLLDLVIEAFAGVSCFQLVVTSGRLAGPPAVPAGGHAASTMPGSAVLAHAKLVIHAGGTGTTYQALAAGVPMIVVPYVAGQDLYARLAQRHGVGIGYRPDRLTGDRLLRGTAHIIAEDSYRAAAATFAGELANHNGLAVVADVVEGLGQ